MKVVSSKDFKLEREVEYGTPEQNQAVKEIVAAIKKKETRRFFAIRSNLTGSYLRRISCG